MVAKNQNVRRVLHVIGRQFGHPLHRLDGFPRSTQVFTMVAYVIRASKNAQKTIPELPHAAPRLSVAHHQLGWIVLANRR